MDGSKPLSENLFISQHVAFILKPIALYFENLEYSIYLPVILLLEVIFNYLILFLSVANSYVSQCFKGSRHPLFIILFINIILKDEVKVYPESSFNEEIPSLPIDLLKPGLIFELLEAFSDEFLQEMVSTNLVDNKSSLLLFVKILECQKVHSEEPLPLVSAK